MDVGDLTESAPSRDLLRYRRQFHCLLLDEGRIAQTDLSGMKHQAAALFRLETRRGSDDIRNILGCLIDRMREPAQRSLRRAFAVWMRRVLLPAKIPGMGLEGYADIQEAPSMLAERVKKWTEEWKQQGIDRGIPQGAAQILRRQLARRFGPLPDWGRGQTAPSLNRPAGRLGRSYPRRQIIGYGFSGKLKRFGGCGSCVPGPARSFRCKLRRRRVLVLE